MNYNGISIVIATKGRLKLLEDLLKSVQVARSNFDKPTEVLLVDDSNDADLPTIERLCSSYGARRIPFGPSVPQKRNVGAHYAQFDIVLFLDSDCLATPNILNEHYRLYGGKDVAGVAGYLEFTEEGSWFWGAVEKTPFVICFDLPRWLDTVPWTATANFSVLKHVYEQVGGCDKAFPDKPGGEDVDLGLKITKAGYTIKCTAAGKVYHSKETWQQPNAMFKRLWHYGAANYYLADRHPDYRFSIMPRKSFVLFVGLLACIAFAVLKANIAALLVFPIWILLDLVLTALCMRSIASERATFLQQIAIELMFMDNELGYVITCMKKGKPSYINKDLIYFDGQLEGVQKNSSVMIWCNLISLLLVSSALWLL